VYNIDKEKKVILIMAVPLAVSAFFLAALGQGMIVFGANSENEKNYKTETIYERRECSDGQCRDAGKKLISFKGMDAECENFSSEEDRMRCYNLNSQAAYSCPNLENEKEVRACFERYKGLIYDHYQGGAGTLVANKSLTVKGSRMYLDGFDCNAEHHIQTGTVEPANSAITFYDSSRDVHYGGNLDIYNDVVLLSALAGMYFGSNVQYGEMDLGGGTRGQGMVDYENFHGFNMNPCLDLRMMANHRHLLTFSGSNRGVPAPFGRVEVEKGMEVNGDLKADFMYFQGRFLKWSEPIRGNFILYYNSQPVAPTKCALPDYPRDQNQPNETPPLYDPPSEPK
jgi:hypothetical protein